MQKNVLLGAAVLGLLMWAGSTASAALVTFQLGAPTIVGTTASLDVSFTFALEQSETTGTLDTIGLSVVGSDPALTDNGADFSRFSFDADSPFASWDDGGLTIDVAGFVIFDGLGDPIGPGTYTLGTLHVDLSGLSEASVVVRIDGGGTDPGDDNTFYAGLVDEQFIFGTPNAFTPGEQSIDVAPVPEPGTIAIFALGGALSSLSLGTRKRRFV